MCYFIFSFTIGKYDTCANNSNFMLSKLKRLGHGSKSIIFPIKVPPLHAMVRTSGFCKEGSPSYNWHGLKRGKTLFALFQYTLSGKGHLLYEGKSIEVGENKAMLLHFPHDNRYHLPKGWGPWEFVYVSMNGRELMRLWHWLEKQHGPVVSLSPSSRTILTAIKINEMIRTNRIDSAFTCSSLAYELVMNLMKELSPGGEVRSRPEYIKRAIRFCEQNLGNPIGVNEIAKEAGYSRYHFTRLFKSIEGRAPAEYLQDVRLREAAHLLTSTQLAVKEIAAQCGFYDSNYFCKSFRTAMGTSPGNYRKSVM